MKIKKKKLILIFIKYLGQVERESERGRVRERVGKRVGERVIK